jgi:hypothetical protein
VPNLQDAALIIAKHQAAGKITPGTPVRKLLTLIAPLALMGSAPQPMRSMVGEISQMNPDDIAADFLNGHSV